MFVRCTGFILQKANTTSLQVFPWYALRAYAAFDVVSRCFQCLGTLFIAFLGEGFVGRRPYLDYWFRYQGVAVNMFR